MLISPSRVFAPLFCAAVALTASGVARAETLADAMVSAYRNSNLLEQNRSLLRVADEDVAVQLALLRPTLDYIATFNHSTTDPIGASLSNNGLTATMQLRADFVIFDSGQRELELQAARETVLATREALLNVEQSVLNDAVGAFFSVSSATAFFNLQASNLRLIEQELKAARDRFEVGEVTRTDVALAESRLAAARSQLAATQGELLVSRESYKAAVGRFPGRLVAPRREPDIPARIDDAKRIAMRTHPLIRQAQREVTVAELTAKAASKVYGPSVSLTARHTYTRPNTGDSTLSSTAGVTVSQSIYSGGRLPALERQALARRDAARASLHQTVLAVEQSVGQAWAQLQIARAQIRAADQQITAARVAFEGTREEARLGARTTLDVLDAEQELLDARANRIDADNQRNEAIYSLLSSMGLLTAKHLNLGIATYDPEAYYNAVKSAPARHSTQGNRLDRVLKGIGRD